MFQSCASESDVLAPAMSLPESALLMLACKSPMLDILRSITEEDWHPISLAAATFWAAAYCLFMLYAAMNDTGFLFIDNVNLVIHEGGHLLFGWFGPTLGLWGGTLLQWLVPALLAAYFFTHRHTTGFAFSTFALFENFLYTATYMADARAQVLPLVTVGDPEGSGHDWYNIFSSLGLLQHDTQIAAAIRMLGWIGMVATVLWLLWRGKLSRAS